LSDREWSCPQCHTKHHRDINAGINLVNFAKAKLNINTVGTTGIQAVEKALMDLDYENNLKSNLSLKTESLCFS